MIDVKSTGYNISSSPHFSFGNSVQGIMLAVLIAMIPEIICGTVVFGLRALAVVCVSIAGAVGFEALFQVATKQKVKVANLSAAVSGTMIALIMPPLIPFWIVLIADAVAVIIAKGIFGGLGSNVFNPALTGRAVTVISFPAVLGARWLIPGGKVSLEETVDAITSATALTEVKKGLFSIDSSVLRNFFFGYRSGCIGETSAFLIIISFIFLLAIKIIDWRAPLTFVLTVAAGSAVKSIANGADAVLCVQETLLAVMNGGLLFGAVFMVTDYATTPVTKPGRLVFGFGCGLITFLIRTFGGYPEGVMFSILIMNAIAPHLNNLTVRKYGYGKKGNRKPEPKKIVQDFDVANAKKMEESK